MEEMNIITTIVITMSIAAAVKTAVPETAQTKLWHYMLSHNEHHAEELDQMAENLKKMGMEDAAKTIKEGVADFQKGNMRLGLALTLVKEHLKEA